MDTYQKMAESLPLLVDWEPKSGDRFILKNTLYADENEKLTTLKSKNVAFEEGVNFVPSNLSFGDFSVSGAILNDAETLKKHSFFLPCVHQFQEKLLQSSFANVFYLYSAFFKFVFNNELGIPAKYFTIEELWIQFYANENWWNWDINNEGWYEID